MKSISMREFRRDAKAILRRVQQGERLLLTYRGKTVARLLPVQDDPFYRLGQLAQEDGITLSNEAIGAVVYRV